MINAIEEPNHKITEEMNKELIKSVILLTDFSNPAKNAISYAIDAFGESVEYNLVNAFYARTSSATLLDLNDMLAKESEQGLTEEKAWIESKYADKNLSIKTHSIFGSPIDAIKKFKRAGEADMVIMGTKGASGVDAVLFGSVASSVIRATVTPVISVPPSSKYEGFGELVFATDGEDIANTEVLTPLNQLQKQFNSEVDVFSVEKNGEHTNLAAMNLNIENAHYSTVQSDNVVEEITSFCKEKNADLLVILPKHTGFFDRLFHKSISKELIEQAQMPILALEND